MSEAIDPSVSLRPGEARAIIDGRAGTCIHCDEPGVWQPVRFKRKNKVLHLLLTRDDFAGDIIWWADEFVALKPGDDVNEGIATWRAHGKECAVRIADAEGQEAEEFLLAEMASPNFFPDA